VTEPGLPTGEHTAKCLRTFAKAARDAGEAAEGRFCAALTSVMSADIPKLKAAIAHLCGSEGAGKVKLFKLLYFSDFTAYARLGRAITWDTYEHFTMGPVPKTLWHNFNAIASDCVDIKLVHIGLPRPEQQMRAKPDTDITALDADDKTVLDDIRNKYGHLNGARLRDLTHDTIPYRATRLGDEIPYALAFYLEHLQNPTEEEVKRIVNPEIDA
jgi:uncharacterized phage-associated protein